MTNEVAEFVTRNPRYVVPADDSVSPRQSRFHPLALPKFEEGISPPSAFLRPRFLSPARRKWIFDAASSMTAGGASSWTK